MQGHDTPSLAGRVALVTGAGRRVGRAIALELARAGAAVVVHHRTAQHEAEQLCDQIVEAGGYAQAAAADLRDAAACRKLVDGAVAWGGRLDLLVNSASPWARVPFVGGDDLVWEAAWRDALDVNLLAPARLARRAAPALGAESRSGGRPGVIVNVLDIAAWQAWPGYAHHGASKAALAHLTKTLAVALAPDVRCVGVAPGIVDWPDDVPKEEREQLVARVPLGRAGEPADVARAVLQLIVSPYVNGTVLTVDGGRLAAGQ